MEMITIMMRESYSRIYLDCSVFGGYYDKEFKKDTIPLFEKIFKGKFRICISTINLFKV